MIYRVEFVRLIETIVVFELSMVSQDGFVYGINRNNSCIWINTDGEEYDMRNKINRNNSCIWIFYYLFFYIIFYWLIETIVVFELKLVLSWLVATSRLIETIVVFEFYIKSFLCGILSWLIETIVVFE